MNEPPVHWPSLGADEAVEEWDRLRTWVEDLFARYPNGVRLPKCWWRHWDIVEILQALRDHERASFCTSAPATAAVDWQRAMFDVEHRLELWIKRLPCAVPGRGHPPATVDPTPPAGWAEFVDVDVQRRRAEELDAQEI